MKITPKSNPRGAGRKPKPPAEKRSQRIVVKATEAEVLQFTESAHRQGKAVSTWMRDLAIAAR